MESDKGSPQALIRIRTNFQSIDGPLPKFGFSGSFRNGPANTITRGHKSILRNYDSHREGQATLITIEATRGFYQQSQWLVQKYEVWGTLELDQWTWWFFWQCRSAVGPRVAGHLAEKIGRSQGHSKEMAETNIIYIIYIYIIHCPCQKNRYDLKSCQHCSIKSFGCTYTSGKFFYKEMNRVLDMNLVITFVPQPTSSTGPWARSISRR